MSPRRRALLLALGAAAGARGLAPAAAHAAGAAESVLADAARVGPGAGSPAPTGPQGAASASATGAPAEAPPAAPEVRPGAALVLPRDLGAHPDFRSEWWYVTGWLEEAEAADAGAARADWGFQITFFRTRTGVAAGHPSRFAARELLSAHMALSDPRAQRLRHDQRVARAGFGLAEASSADTDVVLRGWRLAREGPLGAHRYVAALESAAQGFGLALRFDATQPVLFQGDGGYSSKAPEPRHASYYLSEPQLAASGTLRADGRVHAVRGRAWLDHEWSEALLHPDAVGWDWIGMNLDDGAALTAFQLRRRDGSALWAGGSFRAAGGAPRAFAAEEVRFTPLRRWASPATRARYPVHWRIETPAGRHEVRARFDAQELDGRASTGAVYWEGLSELLDSAGRRVGRGYLELTGYATALRL